MKSSIHLLSLKIPPSASLRAHYSSQGRTNMCQGQSTLLSPSHHQSYGVRITRKYLPGESSHDPTRPLRRNHGQLYSDATDLRRLG